MDKLNAYRTFRKSSYTPVDKRIYKDRWYLCTFQNIERDGLTDYIGLGEGEYQELLPGDKAREARDARLNHLNAIREWNGQVWKVIHPYMYGLVKYFGSKDEADNYANKVMEEGEYRLKRSLQSIEKELNMSDSEILNIYGKCQGWPGHEQEKIEEFRSKAKQSIRTNVEYWAKHPVIERIK